MLTKPDAHRGPRHGILRTRRHVHAHRGDGPHRIHHGHGDCVYRIESLGRQPGESSPPGIFPVSFGPLIGSVGYRVSPLVLLMTLPALTIWYIPFYNTILSPSPPPRRKTEQKKEKKAENPEKEPTKKESQCPALSLMIIRFIPLYIVGFYETW